MHGKGVCQASRPLRTVKLCQAQDYQKRKILAEECCARKLAWAEHWLGIDKMFRKKKATAAPLGQPHTDDDDDEMIGNPCKISAPLTPSHEHLLKKEKAKPV